MKKTCLIILLFSIKTNCQNKLIINIPCLDNYDYVLNNFNKDSAYIKTRKRIDYIKNSEIKFYDSYPFHEIFFEGTCEYYSNFFNYKNSEYLLNFSYGTLILYPNKKIFLEVNSSRQEYKNNSKIGFIRATNLKNLFIQLGINPNRIEITDYKTSRPKARESKKTSYLNSYINIIYPRPE